MARIAAMGRLDLICRRSTRGERDPPRMKRHQSSRRRCCGPEQAMRCGPQTASGMGGLKLSRPISFGCDASVMSRTISPAAPYGSRQCGRSHRAARATRCRRPTPAKTHAAALNERFQTIHLGRDRSIPAVLRCSHLAHFLPGYPPAPSFAWILSVCKIENHINISLEAGYVGRKMRVSAPAYRLRCVPVPPLCQ